MEEQERYLQWAIELQSLAQAGLYYGKDPFDRERYQRIREISAEMIAHKADISLEKARDLFCCETGYQTPKLDCRAALFQDGNILLVRENDGRWSLPGGWVDVNTSVIESTIKEVREEAGLTVRPERIIAIQDREKHNRPVYAYRVCKVFVLCTALGGSFRENIETTESRFFPPDALPPLSEEKNNAEQVQMCFAASRDPNWKTLFD